MGEKFLGQIGKTKKKIALRGTSAYASPLVSIQYCYYGTLNASIPKQSGLTMLEIFCCWVPFWLWNVIEVWACCNHEKPMETVKISGLHQITRVY